MKIKFFAAFLLILSSFVLADAQATQQQTELAKYIQDNYTKREVMIPMRDGVKLFTSIYEPKDKSVKYPILLNRTPYTVGPYGVTPDKFRGSLGPSELYAREGYIFANQDVRGKTMSEGEFEDVRPDIDNKTPKDIDESTDTYDTIDWLVKNVENNNGRVGTYGISYPGFYTSAGSIDSHPALKACSPQAPIGDWFRGDDMHHNGALFLAQNYSFFRGFGQYRPTPNFDFKYIKEWTGRKTADGYDYFLSLGGLKEVADSYEKGLGVRIKFWDEMMAHPNYDQWWKDRNILPKLKNIKCATMTVGGWYDNEDLYGAQKTYKAIEKQNPGIFNVLVLGPWDHGGWSRNDGDWLGTAYFGEKTGQYYREKLELPFFNHFLKDKGDISNIKEVNAFDTGSHDWKSFEGWDPKAGITESSLYLQPGGKLSFDKPSETQATAYDEYVSDPMKPVPYTQKITANYPRDFMTEDQRFVSTRPDVLVYQTDVLTDDVTVAGDIHPELYISSSGTDSDFIVKLIDVFPDDYTYPKTGTKNAFGQDEYMKPPQNSAWSVFQPGGYEMLLRGEPFPARFRNSFEKPEPLKANEPAKIKYEMPGITHTFKKGHRIMVQIQSTWFPLVARNPQKYMENYLTATNADFQKATERVYYGGKTSSMIVLPILKK
ncbi:MAG TPA: CocE/NonD family hydrolase [Pyrinomonadaceae bacterium]|nr:CocE/NonD family hydrolase [Pyrinomonadaceae bacterium]